MAGVPCINDTCSVTSTVDANGRLNLNVRLDPDGGLVCTDGEGVGVGIHGDPAAVSPGLLDTCDTLLGVTTENKLFARRPGYEIGTLQGTQQDLAAGGSATSLAAGVVSNNADCIRLLVYRVAWLFSYELPDNQPDGFGASGQFHLDLSGIGTSFTNHPFAFSGAIPSGAGSQNLIEANSAVSYVPIGASQAIAFTSRATRDTGWGTVDGTGGSNGFISTVRWLMIDLDQDTGLAT